MAAAPVREQEYVYVQPVGFPGRTLAFGLFPVAMAPPVPLPWPDWGSVHPLCPYIILTLAWAAAGRANRNGRIFALGWPTWLFLATLLSFQILAMHNSVLRWEVRPIDALTTYGRLLPEIATLLLYAIGVRLLCNTPGAPAWLARGAIFSLVALLGVCALQLAWLLTGPEFRDWLGQMIVFPRFPDSLGKVVAALHEQMTPILAFIGAWLEARAPFHPNEIYANGAYTLTVLRVNGIFATASDLAVILAAAYVPLVMAGLATAGVWTRRLYFLLATGIIAALAGGRSPATLLACLFFLVWLGWRILWVSGRRARAVLAILLAAGLILTALYHDPAGRRLADRMSEPGAMPLPEEIVALELWSVIRDHPWIGVGYGWSTTYVVNGSRYEAALGDETAPEFFTWREDARALPTPSVLLELAAIFGIPFALAVAASFFWLRRRLLRLGRPAEAELERRFALAAVMPYSTAVAVFVLGDVCFTNPLPLLPYLGLWAMVDVWERPVAGRGPGKERRPFYVPPKTGLPKKIDAGISDSPTRPFTRSNV